VIDSTGKIVDPGTPDPQDERVAQMLERTIDVSALAPEVSKQDPVDAADTLEQLEREERSEVIDLMEDEAAAYALSEMVPPLAAMALRDLTPADAARYLALMDPDDAADLLQEADDDVQAALMPFLPRESAEELGQLLDYDPDTAGGIMTTDFVVVLADHTVADSIAALRADEELDEDTTAIFVVDEDGRLVGEVSLVQLLLAQPMCKIADLMLDEVDAISVDLDQEDVAQEFDRHDYYVLPVIDDDQRLVGIVTVDDVIDIIREEATEDAHKMVGAAAGEAVYSGLREKLAGRFPWLLVNLVTSFVAAVIVLQFAGIIEQLAILAVLMPVIANQAGNAGQQSLAVTLRGLVLGEVRAERVMPLLTREVALGLITGASVGLLMALVIGLAAWVAPNADASWQLGLVVACSMTGALAVGCLVGTGVPILVDRLGRDPATASTIFLTMVTDSVSFLTFLGLAYAFRGWLPGIS
jgi:magnesium transporter